MVEVPGLPFDMLVREQTKWAENIEEFCGD